MATWRFFRVRIGLKNALDVEHLKGKNISLRKHFNNFKSKEFNKKILKVNIKKSFRKNISVSFYQTQINFFSFELALILF